MRWDAFFGDDNVADLQWNVLSDPKSPLREKLQPFLDLVEQRAPIAALPRVRSGPDRIDWYIGWRSDSHARFAADLISAFLGRTYARLDGPVRPLEPADAAEAAFAEEYGGRAFRVEVSTPLRRDARDQLLRMARCLQNRNVRQAVKVRPVGRILRDLEFTLQAGDDALATSEIRALRAGGHLDEANLAFLDLRRLAAKRDWPAMFAHETLPSVLDLRSLPYRVRLALLEAIYHSDLAELVEQGAIDEALVRFAQRFPAFNVALSSRTNVHGLEADVCFLLADELRQTGNAETVAATLARIHASGRVAFVEAFRTRIVLPTTGTVPAEASVASAVDIAQSALVDGDLDRAFIIALDAAPSQKRVKVLLQCARLLDDETASIAAVKAWDHLPEVERESLRAHAWCRTHYEHLTAQLGRSNAPSPPSAPVVASAAPAPTSSWLAWFERLRDHAAWPGAVSRASKGVAEWDIEPVANNADAIATIVEIIEGSLAEWAAEALRQALPYVLEAFLDDGPDARLSPVFSSLFELLATDDALSLSSISALLRLAHARLATSPLQYRSTVDVVTTALQRADTPRTVRIIADALEMLIVTPCASQDERTTAATRLATLAARWWPRVDEVDRALVRQLATELRVGELVPAEAEMPATRGEGDTRWDALAGLQIALYSLNEGALARAAFVLERACPKADFKIFREFGGTDSMKEAAKTADLFVIATKSAKHAATDAITHNRPPNKATEFASGKGSSSLLDAVRRWLGKQLVS
jgi:hypothetical protein